MFQRPEKSHLAAWLMPEPTQLTAELAFYHSLFWRAALRAHNMCNLSGGEVQLWDQTRPHTKALTAVKQGGLLS